jgi:hypothetical protein
MLSYRGFTLLWSFFNYVLTAAQTPEKELLRERACAQLPARHNVLLYMIPVG